MTNPNQWTDPLPVTSIRLEGIERALILSDLHLGDGTSADPFGAKDAALLELLEREATRSEIVVIAGDVMDCFSRRRYRRIPTAHPELVARLRQLAAEHRLYGVWGNHDKAVVLFDLLPEARFADAIFLGERTLVIHGHQCDFHFETMAPGVGPTPIMNFHGRLEAWLKQPVRLPFQRYDNRVNNVVHFGFYWLMRMRLYSALGHLRRGNEAPARRWLEADNFWARGQYNDLGELMLSSWLFLASHPLGAQLDTVVMGHSHVPGHVRFSDDVRPNLQIDARFDHYLRHRSKFPPFRLLLRRFERFLEQMAELEPALPDVPSRGSYLNLGSWVHEASTYAIYERGALRLHDWANGDRLCADENYRLVTGREPLPGTAEWFRRYTRGLARYDAEAIREDLVHRLARSAVREA
ncbi:MAG: metallophosphoesterase family protein [Myxococcales bacterium]|nr:metallophosphoesterase family protein [Myxococcales bacterium]